MGHLKTPSNAPLPNLDLHPLPCLITRLVVCMSLFLPSVSVLFLLLICAITAQFFTRIFYGFIAIKYSKTMGLKPLSTFLLFFCCWDLYTRIRQLPRFTVGMVFLTCSALSRPHQTEHRCSLGIHSKQCLPHHVLRIAEITLAESCGPLVLWSCYDQDSYCLN